MVKNPPSNATDEGSIPGQGPKIPHVVAKRSPRERAQALWSLCAATKVLVMKSLKKKSILSREVLDQTNPESYTTAHPFKFMN